MGMLSDRMCGGDGFGEARKEGYTFGPYLADCYNSEDRKGKIQKWKDDGNPLSKEMEKEINNE